MISFIYALFRGRFPRRFSRNRCIYFLWCFVVRVIAFDELIAVYFRMIAYLKSGHSNIGDHAIRFAGADYPGWWRLTLFAISQDAYHAHFAFYLLTASPCFSRNEIISSLRPWLFDQYDDFNIIADGNLLFASFTRLPWHICWKMHHMEVASGLSHACLVMCSRHFRAHCFHLSASWLFLILFTHCTAAFSAALRYDILSTPWRFNAFFIYADYCSFIMIFIYRHSR